MALGGLLARLQGARVDSIGLLGSTGTYVYLSRLERRRALNAAAECVGGRLPILVVYAAAKRLGLTPSRRGRSCRWAAPSATVSATRWTG